eukprot:jgi/Mesen1/2670/ME000167S01822
MEDCCIVSLPRLPTPPVLELRLSKEALRSSVELDPESCEQQLLEAKYGIMAARTQLGLDVWSLAAQEANLYELVPTVAAVAPLSRAFFKMAELIHVFHLVPPPSFAPSFDSAHLCEGPGGFVEATVAWRAQLIGRQGGKAEPAAGEEAPVFLARDEGTSAPPGFQTGGASCSPGAPAIAGSSRQENGSGTEAIPAPGEAGLRRWKRKVWERGEGHSSGSGDVEGLLLCRGHGGGKEEEEEEEKEEEELGGLCEPGASTGTDTVHDARHSQEPEMGQRNDRWFAISLKPDRPPPLAERALGMIGSVGPPGMAESRLKSGGALNACLAARREASQATGTDATWHLSSSPARSCSTGGLERECSLDGQSEEESMSLRRAGGCEGHVHFGADGSGNLMVPDNIRAFRDHVRAATGGRGVQLVTADGAFDVSSDFGAQEALHARLVFCQLLCALEIQAGPRCLMHLLALLAEGGSMVLKLFDSFSAASATVLHLICSAYREARLVRLRTTRACNSERYVVAAGFLGCHCKCTTPSAHLAAGKAEAAGGTSPEPAQEASQSCGSASASRSEGLCRMHLTRSLWSLLDSWHGMGPDGKSVAPMLARPWEGALLDAMRRFNGYVVSQQVRSIGEAISTCTDLADELPPQRPVKRRQVAVARRLKLMRQSCERRQPALKLCATLGVPVGDKKHAPMSWAPKGR